jgi:SAM-dependent methyltransferase
LWQAFLDEKPVTPGDDVIDIGCGTGRPTRDAARASGTGSVIGFDLSEVMLAEARRRAAAEGLTNVRFERGDAQVHPFAPASADVAMSSFGAMFFLDPVAAFANIGVALRPGGHLELLAWRHLRENEWIQEIRAALAMGRTLPEPPPTAPTPFSLAEPDRVRSLLGDAGYEAVELDPLDAPMTFGVDADDAFGFVRSMGIVGGLSHELDEPERAEALERLAATIADHAGPDGVRFAAAAWRITARSR